jgi:hypothetical protein
MKPEIEALTLCVMQVEGVDRGLKPRSAAIALNSSPTSRSASFVSSGPHNMESRVVRDGPEDNIDTCSG